MDAESLKAFFETTRDQLVPLYKATVASWNAWITNDSDDKSRKIQPLKLLYVRGDISGTGKIEDSIVIDLFHKSANHDIFWGCSIGTTNKNELHGYTDSSNDHETGYRCNVCTEKIIGLCYNCEKCDFDLCSKDECQKVKHEHPMIKLDGYFGINTFEADWIIAELTVPID
jgi:hypothetical protein